MLSHNYGWTSEKHPGGTNAGGRGGRGVIPFCNVAVPATGLMGPFIYTITLVANKRDGREGGGRA